MIVPSYHYMIGPLSAFLAEVERRGLSGVRPVARGHSLPLPLP